MKLDLSRMFDITPRAGLPGVRQVTGGNSAAGLRVGIVASRFNPDLTGGLVDGAVAALRARGAAAKNITVAWVPGAFEIPVVLNRMAASGRFDALIALGAVLEGKTAHAQMISSQVNRALMETALVHDLPVIDGVVCATSRKIAAERCLDLDSGRGWYCAMAALEAASVLAALPKAKS